MIDSNFNPTTFLDKAAAKLQALEDVGETVDTLGSELYSIRQQSSPEAWKGFATVICRQHPLMQLLQQDPFTWRAFSKPRGYAGDAVMIDFIYAPEDGFAFPAVEGISELGRQICQCTSNQAAPRAVRARRRVIIDKLNDLAANKPKPHVLSLACGHVREAKRCSAFLEGRIGRFVAVDQDKESLAVVERELGPLRVEPVYASVRDLLTGQVAFSGFDLVYVSGLHDYLLEPVAQRLSEVLFGMLNPSGRLLINNYLPNLINTGYMEAYMDWWLIYRSETELRQLAATLPREQVESISFFAEEQNIIAFLEVERKG
jgi:extracellular factor (EF) 3-hydroxypalmitic acid methyl ester biosynthesis protein